MYSESILEWEGSNLESVYQHSLEFFSDVQTGDFIEGLALESVSNKVTVKDAMDAVFEGVVFDREFINKLIRVNIAFTTSNKEVISLLGDRLIGCYSLSYTQYHKNCFYEDLFDGLSYNEVVDKIKTITTVRRDFKIALDDINLTCFYMLHRFLTDSKLKDADKHLGALESLNYFGYRTILMMNNKYWIYPITEDKARTVFESLNRGYLITKMKNWNEYVYYRSTEYLKGTWIKIAREFKDDLKLPNAINDLFGHYNSTVKNIYRAFEKIEKDDFLKSSKNIVTDVQGREVLMDRINDPQKYVDSVIDLFVDSRSFIRSEVIEVTMSIIDSLSARNIQDCLEMVLDYYYSSPKASKEMNAFVEDFITDSLEYLQSKRFSITDRTNVVDIINIVVGNLLNSRGANITITHVKERGEKLISEIYRKNHASISNRNLAAMRNAFCVYLLILAFV